MLIRDKKIRYVDMCIYVDKYILDEDADTILIYNYLSAIALMLARKRKFFKTTEDYENFSTFMANIVYMRMTTPRQFLSEDDPRYLTPIKSCLNYMKQILYGRKCVFIAQEYNFATDEKDVSGVSIHRKYMEQSLHNSNDLLECDVCAYFECIEKIIRKEVYDGMYGKNLSIA